MVVFLHRNEILRNFKYVIDLSMYDFDALNYIAHITYLLFLNNLTAMSRFAKTKSTIEFFISHILY